MNPWLQVEMIVAHRHPQIRLERTQYHRRTLVRYRNFRNTRTRRVDWGRRVM